MQSGNWRKDGVESGVQKRLAGIDLLKHMATVSIAAIAVIAAMALGAGPSGGAGAYKVAIIGFLITVACSTYACFALMAKLESYPSWIGAKSHRVYQLIFVLMLLGFFVGVFSVAYAAFKQLA